MPTTVNIWFSGVKSWANSSSKAFHVEPLWADLILQPAAVILLLLQILPQLYSVPVGHDYLPLSFLVVVPLSIQQVFLLCSGDVPFPDVLVGLGKLLHGRRNKTGTQTLIHVQRAFIFCRLLFRSSMLYVLVWVNMSFISRRSQTLPAHTAASQSPVASSAWLCFPIGGWAAVSPGGPAAGFL